ncbi:MAG: TIM barrel protein [Fimbriiglobus sp.]|nr:TIM barrel protein [Fimbriiglobus sp.]
MARVLLPLLLLALPAAAADPFVRPNLSAWCIVPFDAKKRGPEERVKMLQRLGFTRYVYDWRAEHLPTFDQEVELLQKAGITLQGVWFPAGVGKDGETLLTVLKKHRVKTELWVMLPQPDAKLSQENKVKVTAELVAKLAKTAGDHGHKVGLYNHGGWTGEPDNLVAVAKASGAENVGIVYNLHHAHHRMNTFADDMKLMRPHLLSLNLNGMEPDGDTKGRKILCLGDGTDDAKLLAVIRDSGYAGPVGIIGHTDDDAEDRLTDNLNGLACLLRNDDFRPAFRTVSVRTVVARLETPKPDAPLAFTVKSQGAKPEQLRVYVADDARKLKDYTALTPLAGTAVATPDGVRFTPRFPPSPGTRYRLFFDDFTAEFTVAKRAPPPPPEVYKFVKLLRADGSEVKDAFLEIGEELWTPDGTRLTLLFDPGRVKRGLKPREVAGPILESGKSYEVVVSKNWPDADGFPLKAEKRWKFTAADPDDTPVDPKKWTLSQQGRGPLVATFDKPLDHALAARMVWVEKKGKKIDAVAVVGEGATSVRFDGKEEWRGEYTLVVDTRLEDVCGNRVGQAFEVDILKPPTAKIEVKTVRREFEIK